MLSIYPISSSEAAADYFEKDNYYTKNDPEAVTKTAWWGKGAAALGLSGQVDYPRFMELLDGKIDKNTELGRIRHDGGVTHKLGYDLTFSAPKSVSMLAFIAGDRRLIDLHHQAVSTALDFLQKEAARTRTTVGGKTQIEKAENLVVAQFVHDLSRGMTQGNDFIVDCQLHTHSVVMNMIQCSDGQWRSLAEKRLYQLMKLAGLVYRNTYANLIQQETGYSVEKTTHDGLFEIQGFTREHIELFSNRHLSISQLKKELGVDSYLGSKRITALTREAKREIDREALMQQWRQRIDAGKVPLDRVYEQGQSCRGADEFIQRDRDLNALAAVDYAVAHLSERKAVFTREDILLLALGEGIVNTTFAAVEAAIQAKTDSGQLVSVGERVFTTAENLAKEREMVCLMQQTQNTLPRIGSLDAVDLYLEQLKASHPLDSSSPPAPLLTKGQEKAIRLLLTNQDRFVGIQGFAGVGKTTLLRHAIAFMQQAGFSVQGLAPTGVAAHVLEESLGQPSDTISHFISQTQRQAEKPEKNRHRHRHSMTKKPTVLMIDEASMLSTQQAYDLQQIAMRHNYRVVFVGDRLQFSSISAGNPFASLQDNGMQTVTVKQLVRQRDSESQRLAVKYTIAQDIVSAFKKMAGNITQIYNKEERLEYLVNQYLELSPAERQETLIAVMTHADRASINEKIREGLALSSVANRVTDAEKAEYLSRTLKNKSLTGAQKQRVSNYEIGDVVRFNREYFTVTGMDEEKQVLKLKREQVKNFSNSVYPTLELPVKHIPLQRHFILEAFTRETKSIRAGDLIRFTDQIKRHRIRNTETATVTAVKKHQALVLLQNGQSIKLDLRKGQYQHWDYAWSSTVYASQGKTAKRVLAMLESSSKQLTNFRAFYVMISRASHSAHLVVDDTEKVIRNIARHSGENAHALNELAIFRKRQQFNHHLMASREKLNGCLHINADRYVRLEKLARHYACFADKDRRKALLIVPHYADRVIVNALVREQLKQNQVINAQGWMSDCLEPKWIADFRRGGAYRVGQMVRFTQIPSNQGIVAGEYGKIVKVIARKRRHQITVETASGRHRISLAQWFEKKTTAIEVFEKKPREIAIGDELRWTRSNPSLGMVKGKTATVTEITESHCHLKSRTGKTLVLRRDDTNTQHFEYAYANRLPTEVTDNYHHVLAHFDEKLDSASRQAVLLASLGAASRSAHLYSHNEEFIAGKIGLHTETETSINAIQDRLGMREKILMQLQAYQTEHRALRQSWADYFKAVEKAKKTMTEIDDKLSGELAADKNAVDAAKTVTAIELREQAQEELAADLINSQQLTDGVIKAFQIDVNKLHHHAARHEAKQRVIAYQAAASPAEKQLLASEMIKQYLLHWSEVKKAQLAVNRLCYEAWTHQNKQAHSFDEMTAKNWQQLGDYLAATLTASTRWRHIARLKSHGRKIEKTHYQAANAPSDERNALAFTLQQNREAVNPLIEKYLSVDRDFFKGIEKHAANYRFEHRIKSFSARKDDSDKYKLADSILNDYQQYWRYVDKYHLRQQDLHRYQWQHLKYGLQQPLSKKDREFVRWVDDYFVNAQAARQGWAGIADKQEQQKPISSLEKKAAFKRSRSRNHCAYWIEKNKVHQQTLLNGFDERAKKSIAHHAAKFEESVKSEARYRSALATKDWQHVLAYQVEAQLNQADQERLRRNPTQHAKNTPITRLHHQRHVWNKRVLFEASLPHLERIVSHLLNKPKNERLSRGNLAVWGNKGAVKVHLEGDKRGMVNDFESDIHTSIVNYYVQTSGMAEQQALSHLAALIGITADTAHALKNRLPLVKNTQQQQRQQARQRQQEKKQLAAMLRKRQKAQRLWHSAIPIQGTPVQTYLEKYRHIREGLDKLELRYHPRAIDYGEDRNGKFKVVYRPAMIAAIKDNQGQVLSIQSTYLDPKTYNQHKALPLSKRTLGYGERLAAKIYSGGGNEVIIAEGAETAASLIVAKPTATIYSSFGRVGTIANYGYLAQRHGTDTLLIAADNDDADPKSKTWQSVQKAAIQLAQQGITVNIAKPAALTAKDSFYEKPVKTDFNDILQQRGAQAVIDNIQPNYTAVKNKSFINSNQISFSIIPLKDKKIALETQQKDREKIEKIKQFDKLTTTRDKDTSSLHIEIG